MMKELVQLVNLYLMNNFRSFDMLFACAKSSVNALYIAV